MKVVILAGGRGTRIAEESATRPKPMVEIGGKPLLWHIMAHYAGYGYKDFLVACGYKGELIKEYFRNAFLGSSDFVVELKDGSVQVLNPPVLDWRVGLIDTGLETMTGGRLRRLAGWTEAHYLTLAPHNVGGPVATAANVHFATATRNVDVLEHFNDFADPWVSELVDVAPTVDPADGCFAPSDRPGLGLRLDHDACARHPRTGARLRLFEPGCGW